MKTEGSKTKNAYEAAYQRYLDAGKRYASLLRDAMQLDPKILKIAEEILTTGDGLSAHDSKILTDFYNELRTKSKIEKKYYDLLISLRKAKNDLDIATDALSKSRVEKIIKESGIPVRKTSLTGSAKVAHINNPSINLLEKMSYPDVLPSEFADELAELSATGELIVAAGTIKTTSKRARDFIKRVESGIRENVNNRYLLGKNVNFTKSFCDFSTNNMSLLDLVRLAGDAEHVREIERKLESGDIYFSGGELVPATEKGNRYLGLLAEELVSVFDRKLNSEMQASNCNCIDSDSRLRNIREEFEQLDHRVARHEKYAGISKDTLYSDLSQRARGHHSQIESMLAQLMVQIETISRSFLNIKKQLLVVSAGDEINVERLLVLLAATRFLSGFEQNYKKNLTEIETLLGISTKVEPELGPAGHDYLTDLYAPSEDNFNSNIDDAISELISERLSARRHIDDRAERLLLDSVLGSPEASQYRDTLRHLHAVKSHVAKTLLDSGCLYSGIGDLSCLIEELVDLELEKREKIASFIHHFETAHKELWLNRIKNSNRDFIANNFPEVAEEIRTKATSENDKAVSAARQEITAIVEAFKSEHSVQTETFNKLLKASLAELKSGADVAQISTKLKNAYKNMLLGQESALQKLEGEILNIERRLTTFEKSSQADLEKVLISDIRKSL